MNDNISSGIKRLLWGEKDKYIPYALRYVLLTGVSVTSLSLTYVFHVYSLITPDSAINYIFPFMELRDVISNASNILTLFAIALTPFALRRAWIALKNPPEPHASIVVGLALLSFASVIYWISLMIWTAWVFYLWETGQLFCC